MGLEGHQSYQAADSDDSYIPVTMRSREVKYDAVGLRVSCIGHRAIMAFLAGLLRFGLRSRDAERKTIFRDLDRDVDVIHPAWSSSSKTDV